MNYWIAFTVKEEGRELSKFDVDELQSLTKIEGWGIVVGLLIGKEYSDQFEAMADFKKIKDLSISESKYEVSILKDSDLKKGIVNALAG